MGFWMARILIPVNPVNPIHPIPKYFLKSDGDKMEYFNWSFGEFQPVYLNTTKKDNKTYFNVAYRSTKNVIRFMKILVGQEGTESAQFVNFVNEDNTVATINNATEYKKYLKFGDRIRVRYLRNITQMQGDTTDEVVTPTDLNIKIICSLSPQNCLSIQKVKDNPEPYWNFLLSEKFPSRIDFPVILIYKQILMQE